MSKFTELFESQTGGYPLDQVLMIEVVENGVSEPAVIAFVADVEMDVFCIEFGVEGEIVFDTSDLAHLMLYPSHLKQITKLAKDGAALREELSSYFDADVGNWVGHEHLFYRPSV